VKEYEPGAVVTATLTLSVAVVVDAEMSEGANVAVMPAGTPSVDSEMDAEWPPDLAMVAVMLPLPPWSIVSDVAERLTVNVGLGGGGLVPPSPPPPQAAAMSETREPRRRVRERGDTEAFGGGLGNSGRRHRRLGRGGASAR
jgi:hypothetical protein